MRLLEQVQSTKNFMIKNGETGEEEGSVRIVRDTKDIEGREIEGVRRRSYGHLHSYRPLIAFPRIGGERTAVA